MCLDEFSVGESPESCASWYWTMNLHLTRPIQLLKLWLQCLLQGYFKFNVIRIIMDFVQKNNKL